MPTENFHYSATVAVDSTAALALWNEGKDLRAIRDAIAPGASRMAVLRAIRRAVKAGGVAISHARKDEHEPPGD